MSNTQFNELAPVHAIDPLAKDHHDFDYEKVADALGEVADQQDADYAKLTEAFRKILTWVIGEKEMTPKAKERIARRAIVLAWAIDPKTIHGTPSIRALAKQLNVNMTSLHLISGEVRRKFQIRNPAYQHGWNFVHETKRELKKKNAAATPKVSY